MKQLKTLSAENLLAIVAFTETKELLDAMLIMQVVYNRAKKLKTGFMRDRIYQVITKPAQFQGMVETSGEYQKALRMAQVLHIDPHQAAIKAKVIDDDYRIWLSFKALTLRCEVFSVYDLLHGATHFVEKSDLAAVEKFEKKFKLKFLVEAFNMRFYKE